MGRGAWGSRRQEHGLVMELGIHIKFGIDALMKHRIRVRSVVKAAPTRMGTARARRSWSRDTSGQAREGVHYG